MESPPLGTSRYSNAYLHPNGPGDARPTALQVVADEQMEQALAGKVALITGCSAGLGIEMALALKATGATLFLTARNLDKAKEVLGDILDGEQVHLLHLDLESLDSVRSCVAKFKSKSKTLNILIENAGIRGVPKDKTKDGFELHWGTNYMSHFLLFDLLKLMMLESSTPDHQSRVILISSTAHRNAPMAFDDLNWETRTYDPILAYGQSKLANIYPASEIERRYGSQGLHAWSVHPGLIKTGILTLSWANIVVLWKCGIAITRNTLASVEQGASTPVWAAISKDLEGEGGKYLEQCRVGRPAKEGFLPIEPGHAEWAYDEESAERLYDMSLKLVQG